MMDQNKIWESFNLKTEKQSPRALAVNTVLAGKYLVGPVLGEGGFGITYAGYDLNMETRIATKEYFPVELVSRDTTRRTEGGGSDRVISLSGEKSKTYQQGLKKYVDEARSVSQFSGTPGIVSVKDFFYENDTAYIVMEYIEGVSLKEYLKQKGGKLPEEAALAILRPVLEALEQVHAAGIVHRDISPDNIMLTFAGEGGAAGQAKAAPSGASGTASKAAGASGTAPGTPEAVSGTVPATVYGNIAAARLIDFGAARMTAKNDQKSLTIILKHGYAPEEQYRSHGEQGPWTDVYALCAVLYRMLTGTVPEPAMDRLFSDGLKRPEELGAAVSPAISEAIMRGLAVKKENRIQTMRELSDALYSGKKLKKAGQEKQRRLFAIAVIAAGLLVVVAAFGIGAALTGKRAESDALTAQVASGQGSLDIGAQGQDGQQDGAAALSENGSPETASTASGVSVGTSADTSVEGQGTPEEVELSLQEEELGEQIVFPSPQTSISGVQQSHTLFCMPDGTVKALGGNQYGQCLVQDWQNVVAVAASPSHSLGLRSDGKVYAAGNNEYGQCETGSWHDIVAVAAGDKVSFGLRADGTVEACGNVARYMDEIASWTGIRAILATELDGKLIGLDEEGNLRYAGFTDEMPQISGWEDVYSLGYGRTYGTHVLGLCEDGSVKSAVLRAYDGRGQYDDAEALSGLQQLCANTPLLGVKKDGTAAFLESADESLQAELRTWTELEAISSAYNWDRLLVFGLRKDGTILEYRQNVGNAELSDFSELKWIQVIPGTSESLAAVTADGRIFTFGMEYTLFEKNTQRLGIRPDELTGFVGKQGYLCADGTLLAENWEGVWSEKDVRQAVELWKGGFTGVNTGAYALLTDSGRVRIYQFGEELTGTGINAETWLTDVKRAEDWTDVVQILGVRGTLFGLHEDGSISCTAEENRDALASISGVRKIAGYVGERAQLALSDILALMEDGTVRPLISDEYSVQFGRTQVTGWKDVADIAVGESHVAGLLSDGTVVAAGSNHAGQCDVEDWENIVFLTAGRNCTLGITADGELKMAGSLY